MLIQNFLILPEKIKILNKLDCNAFSKLVCQIEN